MMNQSSNRGSYKKVARQALNDLLVLSEVEMQKSTLSSWLNSSELPYQKRGVWICEEVFEQAILGGMTARTLFNMTLICLLDLHKVNQVKLMFIAKSEQLEHTRAILWSIVTPTLTSKQHYDDVCISSQEGRTLSLGERRALARKPSAKTIEKLLVDSDPYVLNNLLQNPRLTELMVLKIVTARPQVPNTLMQVYTHQTWGKRTEILRALALNPCTPLPLRCALVHHLDPVELQNILREVDVPRPLKAAINRVNSSLA